MAIDAAVRSDLPGSSPCRETIAGSVERVTFHNADTGFCVLRSKVRRQRDLVTLVGHAAAIGACEYVEAAGVVERPYAREHAANLARRMKLAVIPTVFYVLAVRAPQPMGARLSGDDADASRHAIRSGLRASDKGLAGRG